jgi:hypothetical protein
VAKKQLRCRFCEEQIDKDTKALNRKLINHNQPDEALVCLKCMAETLDCTVEDLRDKIEEYKYNDCTLFR